MGRRWFPSTRLLLPALLLASCSAPGVAQPATSSGAPPPRATATLEFTPTPRPTPTPSGPLTEIKLACLGPQSGDLAFLGKPSLQACQMAVDDFNARIGGIDGLKVQPVAVDGEAQPAVAREQAVQLAADRAVLGVVGPLASSAALAAAPVLDAAHVGFVSQSASLPKISDSGWKTAHRLAAGDDAVGAAAAVFLFGQPVYAKHAFVVDAGDPDSVSLADEFQKRAGALGMKVQRATAASPADAAAAIAPAKPDAVFIASEGPQCGALAGAIRQQAPTLLLMAGMACEGLAEGMFVASPVAGWDATPAGQAWGKEFAARFDAPPAPFSAQAYDAARIVLQAIQGAVAAKGSLEIHPADVNAQIGRTSAFAGLLGPITFDTRGDVQKASAYVDRWSGGALKQVRAFPPPA